MGTHFDFGDSMSFGHGILKILGNGEMARHSNLCVKNFGKCMEQ
jgi:hypothetical protein